MGTWDEEDVVVATREMLLGASGTTREALANALYLLLTDDRVRRAAFATEGALANFVEESLRLHDTRTLVGLPRIAEQDVEVAGVTIARDQLVVMLSDEGSTDPEHYSDPDVVDVARPSPKDHFAFGAGARACIGANLARVQIKTAIETLFARMPQIALDRGREAPARTGLGTGFGHSCYGPLHVTF
jgi:cytochrome P450